MPPGWSDWERWLPAPYRLYNYTLNDDGTRSLRPAACRLRAGRADPQSGRLRRPPGAGGRQPFFLWLTYTAPHGGGPHHDPNRPTNCDNAPKPPIRYAHAFDFPSRCRCRRTSTRPTVCDKPAVIRKLPRCARSRSPTSSGSYRCELEVAARGRRRRQEGDRRAAGHGERSTTRWSSTRPTTGSSTASTGSTQGKMRLRGVDPGAAPDARSRDPARGDDQPAGDQRRPGADDRRRDRRAREPGDGRALASPA